MIRLATILLLLTLPLLGGKPLLGLPMWVWGSLAATLAFAVTIVIIIEKRWEKISEKEPLDG